MKYILDFDHTLFDTAQFVHDAKVHKEAGTLITPEIWDVFSAETYLFDDVIPFLEAVGRENVTILTAITPQLGPLSEAFQQAKLERSGIRKYVDAIVYMVGNKGQHVKMLYDGVPITFVDNMLSQVLSVKQACPECSVLQIIRPNPLGSNEIDGTSPDIPYITSLYEITN